MAHTTTVQQETEALLAKIAALHDLFLKNHDTERAHKAKQLAEKYAVGEFAVAFCGHFSAGKSSMINRLIGERILPSSPIPTSANLVKIKSGKEQAKVFLKNGEVLLFPAPYDFERIKSYCKNGDEIYTVEISHRMDHLPSHAVIMDTPGIDSTDDAHRIATESALHLADIVFYVMDYNHVQSELNFIFLKELTEERKKICLIINQIDKHREDELSFADFKNSVTQSFASWGIFPERIFYTSLKEDEHPENDFPRLLTFIQGVMREGKEKLPQTVFDSLVKLTKEHEQFLQKQAEPALEKLENTLCHCPPEEQDKIFDSLQNAETQLAELASAPARREEQIREEVEKLLGNAYIMPFQTRSLAESYLQSVQPDFKAGWLFARRKTEQERANRLQVFYEDLREKVRAQIEWHMKELFQRELKRDNIHDSGLLGMVREFSVSFPADLLQNTVKPGALLSGQYVLNYTSDVAEAIKGLARRESRRFLTEYRRALDEEYARMKMELELKYSKLLKLAEAYKEKTALLEEQKAITLEMTRYLSGDFEQHIYQETAKQLIKPSGKEKIVREPMPEMPSLGADNQTAVRSADVKKPVPVEAAKTATDAAKREHLIRQLKYAAKELAILPGFKNKVPELGEKAERLEQRRFTVALFGAFSAGKSSFANALIGKKLLPSSPNPTTAAINKILPPDEKNRHGTVKVHLKTKETMFADVNRSLSLFDMTAHDLDDALHLIKKIINHSGRFSPDKKIHYSFLQAFSQGYPELKNKLGEQITTDISGFADFAANEEKSCFVEMIEVYYDSPLARKGIALVDTPGADSINARHTEVAFEYIKNSDAILYVTYYNHAFSKADREFLIQLGRVKDAFELDKMFFIVNAIDLANDDEEKEAVLQYVEEELTKHGIRHPNLFPVSSLAALKEKLGEPAGIESGMPRFEEYFYRFIDHDLTAMTIQAAELEMERSLAQLRTYIQSAREDEQLREERLRKLHDEHERIVNMIETEEADVLLERLGQEIDELIYYVKQRVFYRFGDFFKESFNPAVLKDDGRNLKKAVKDALEVFLKDFGFDFAQELRATTLRIESFIGKLLKQMMETISLKAGKICGELTFSPFEAAKVESPSFQPAFADTDRDLFKKALSYFKNPKTFFENNDRKLMADALEEALQNPAEDYLSREKGNLTAFYTEKFIGEINRLKSRLKEQTSEYYEGMYAALKNEIPLETLADIERKIASVRDTAQPMNNGH